MPKRITVDENGLVVAVEDVPEGTIPSSAKGQKTGAGRKWKRMPSFEWEPSKGPTPDYSAAGRARQREEEKRRRARQQEALRAGAISRDRKKTEEERRAVEWLTDFEEAYALGISASKASPPNYPLAIAAFSKAYRLDPRRKVRAGQKPDPGLFEVPTRLAAAYRLNKQPHEAQKMYEWVLEHHDNRFARVGLAAVHGDEGRHTKALRLYESVLADDPHNRYALRGLARTLANLGRRKEAREAYEKALRASNS